tara:strand:- start:93 stop:410 length:318 start_codon:yes stop_codon:yes gene_type:complete
MIMPLLGALGRGAMMGARGLSRLAVPGLAGYGTYSAIRDLKKRRADKLAALKQAQAQSAAQSRDYLPQTQMTEAQYRAMMKEKGYARGGSVYSRGRKVPGMYHGK